MTQSKDLFKKAVTLMPGGVNSPVRAFGSVGGDPLFMKKGRGAYVFDEDDNRYLDMCGSWGPLILGHCHPQVQSAIEEVVKTGWTYGTPVRGEVDLAQYVVEKLDAVDMVRFVNSGTEAVMSAIRLARGFTGRSAILKYKGCYHGHADYLLVEGGSGLATLGTPSSAGVPAEFAALTYTTKLDDLEGLNTFFDQHGSELACVIVEGVPANNGLLIQSKDYIHTLARLCRDHGALLIFDEVLSGFRMPEVMAYEHYGVTPDLVTLGKVIGGGMPVGAYGGRADIMKQVAPLGPVYQAGTLSGNPVAMAAGLATMQAYFQSDVPAKIDELGQRLDQGINDALSECKHVAHIRLGSLFWFYFYADRAPRSAEEIDGRCAEIYGDLHRFMLDFGVYLAPSAYEVGFLNSAMTHDDIDFFVDGLKKAVKEGILK